MKRRDFVKNSILITSAYAAARCGVSTESKPRVVMLGFDGANWPTIDPLIAKGKLPFLKKLKEEGAWANFKTIKPTKSNVVWSSIASGKTMLKHGILDFAYIKKNGIQVPYTKSKRKAPMIWQILDLYKKRSIVLNWWVSHPPDKINGIMVSDRFRRIPLLNPEKINEFAASVHPETVFYDILKNIGPKTEYQKVLSRTGLADYPAIFKQKFPDWNLDNYMTLKNYPGFVLQDDLIDRTSRYFFDTEDFDLFATYLRLPDIVQHAVTHLLDLKLRKKLKSSFKTNTITPELLDSTILKISDILEPVYQWMENIIQGYMNHKDHRDTYFLIMSDHGFSLYPSGYNHYGLPENYDAPDGILLIKGPEVKPGIIKNAGIFDIVPTILYILKHPVGENMDGRVLKEIFKFNRKIRYRRYKLKQEGKSERDVQYDKETLEELKSLGYISSDS